jgi:superfamily I DNA/RNA helicase
VRAKRRWNWRAKLGTYRRAKGLEFKYVFLPDHDAGLPEVIATTPSVSGRSCSGGSCSSP